MSESAETEPEAICQDDIPVYSQEEMDQFLNDEAAWIRRRGSNRLDLKAAVIAYEAVCSQYNSSATEDNASLLCACEAVLHKCLGRVKLDDNPTVKATAALEATKTPKRRK